MRGGAEDHYVSAGACVACAGYVNARRDGVDGGDTACDENAAGRTNASIRTRAWRAPPGTATLGETAPPVGIRNAWSARRTTACRPARASRAPRVRKSRGDDSTGRDTTCDEKIKIVHTEAFATLTELTEKLDSCADPCDEAKYWDVSQLTSLAGAFQGRSGFNGDISGWDVSKVKQTAHVRRRVGVQPAHRRWDVSSVTNMRAMFLGASAFNQPIGDWDVSSVTTMYAMFRDAVRFNQPISNWNTGNVETMHGMFQRNGVFNQPIGHWDTGRVTDMGYMFNEAAAFNQPIGRWDVSSMTTMYAMFRGARRFDQFIGNWDTAGVDTMHGIFSGRQRSTSRSGAGL